MTSTLIERLKEAEGADRELDLLVWAHKEGARLRHYTVEYYDNCETEVRAEYENGDWVIVGHTMAVGAGAKIKVWHGFEDELPKLTASLDAALALVEECGQTVRYISWHRFEPNPLVVHATVGLTQPEGKSGHHKSPAIALLIALLLAKGADQ